MCSYYAKGCADYVGVWDFDEFFQPRGQNKNILDVLKAMGDPTGVISRPYVAPISIDGRIVADAGSSLSTDRNSTDSKGPEVNTYKGGRGMADGHPHPLCYMLMSSEVSLVAHIEPVRILEVSTLSSLHSVFSSFYHSLILSSPSHHPLIILSSPFHRPLIIFSSPFHRPLIFSSPSHHIVSIFFPSYPHPILILSPSYPHPTSS